jgi:radical SAM protein with 4Fe4S-binding SPASM domain
MSFSSLPDKKLAGFCSAPWTDCITYADGELKACDRNVASFGNWQKDGLKNTWKSEKFQDFRRAVREGRYPDQDCASCHNNGTQRTAESSMGGAFHGHGEFLKSFLGVPYVEEIEKFRRLLALRSGNSEAKAVFPGFYHYLNSLKEKFPQDFAENRDFHNAIVKLGVIAESLEDYLDGALEPRRVATFRQSQLQAKCTARCIMCAGKFTGEIVDGPTMDEKFVDEAFAEIEDVTDFWCNGAEYLYYKEWKKIALMLANEGTKLRVSTNGILLTEPTIKFMIDNKLVRYLTVSLDAATKETLESTRINVNFDKCIDRIRYLLQYAHEKDHYFEFTAAFVMMKRNLEELPAFVHLIQSLRPKGCKIQITVLCQPLENFDVLNYRRFVHGEHHALFGEVKLREIFNEAYKAQLETGIHITFYNQQLKDFIAEGMPFPRYFPRKSDVDILSVDLVRPDARVAFLYDPMEQQMPVITAQAAGDPAKLKALTLKAAFALAEKDLVLQEIISAFPELQTRLDTLLPVWTDNFLCKVKLPVSSEVEIQNLESASDSSDSPLGVVVTSANGSMLLEPAADLSRNPLRRISILALSKIYILVHRAKTRLIGERRSVLLWKLSVAYRNSLGMLGLRINPLPVTNHRRENR